MSLPAHNFQISWWIVCCNWF